MTNVNCHKDNKACKSGVRSAKCIPKHPKPNEILLECGEGTGSRTFTSSNEASFQLAHVTIDTTGLKKPEILIKFSSLVNMMALDSGATVRLQYELFRACGKDELKSLGTWLFEEVGSSPDVFERQTESFSFIYCECMGCPECCEYFVTVTPLEIALATATVSDGRIASIIQPTCDASKDESNLKDGYKESRRKHLKAEEIFLECGQGNGSVAFREPTISQPPVKIAHVSIDTTCLCKPEVLIEFSSIISLDFSVLDVRLEFELFRVCDGGVALSRGVWAFERTNTEFNTAVDKAFSFVFCENVTCSGCCEYFVTVTGIELDVDVPGFFLGATVDNARITAIAQSSKDESICFDSRKLDCTHYMQKSPKPKKAFWECGMGTGSRTFTSPSDSAFQLAQVTIDTTKLSKPKVNIEFSSTVSFERLVNTGRVQLRYELFRVCDGGEPISLGVWFLSRITLLVIDRSTNTFDFTFCDCVTCPGCCDYFVSVTPIEITEGLATATVSNGRIVALAQEV
ncbi:DUF4489 domain-containing protein [Wukongibacter baidiensis]|uniref:DUF4489 domain-containing protein n=1 Tax=Wukongibacter baidiensis TaxID=1723361 RepID=UPI003D7F5B86